MVQDHWIGHSCGHHSQKDRPYHISRIVGLPAISGEQQLAGPKHLLGNLKLSGREIAALSGWFLAHLHGYVKGIIGDKKLLSCLTAQIVGAQSRCNAIIALLITHNLPEKLKKEFRVLINESHSPQNKRNRILHDAWFYEFSTDKEEIKRFKKMARDELVFGTEVVSSTELWKAFLEMRELRLKAEKLGRNVTAALKASREKAP